MVMDETQVKILAWYDNEWGYANRLVELARTVADASRRRATAGSAARPMASGTAATAERRSTRRGDLRNYVLVTGAYWADTLVDGAIRMLVLFYFDQLGYTPVQVASLFVFYEIFGHRHQPRRRLARGAARAEDHALHGPRHAGRRAAACSASRRRRWLVVPYVMASQALSGIAKDLTKMSSKSAVKLVVPEDDQSSLYRWVAILTGSKNALKGVGFFLGGLLLTLFGFQTVDADRWPAFVLDRPARHREPDARPPRPSRREGEVQADVLQQPRGQRARGGADLPLRLARRLVRGRPARSSSRPSSAGASGRSGTSSRSG